jgi:hypothetical protein
MKTIKEKAKEHANEPIIGIQGCKLTAYESFIAGVEFAQRWISVEEELPPECCPVLLCNTVAIFYRVGYLRENRWYAFTNKKDQEVEITHWRPIELD